MNDEIAKLEQMVALLTRKADRERQAKIAAEKLLDEKSRELYLAKQLVEESLSSIQEKSDQDIALIKLKSYLESILLDFNQNFCKSRFQIPCCNYWLMTCRPSSKLMPLNWYLETRSKPRAYCAFILVKK